MGDHKRKSDFLNIVFAPVPGSNKSSAESDDASPINSVATIVLPSCDHAGSYRLVVCFDKSFSPEPSALATIRSPSPSLRFLRMNTMWVRSGEKLMLLARS